MVTAGWQPLITSDRFQMGSLYLTRGVNDQVADDRPFLRFVWESLKRHARADWGEMSPEDKQANDQALQLGDLRIFSAYTHKTLPKIWIITEADRSCTTVLFPEEY